MAGILAASGADTYSGRWPRIFARGLKRDSHAIAHIETMAEVLIHNRLSSFRLFQSCLRAAARTPLGHTPYQRVGGKLDPMIQFDQLLIAMVVCFVAAHLLTAA